MIQTNLILIEGAPGTGKTTISKLLYSKLKDASYDVELFDDLDTPHPVYEMSIKLVESHFINPRDLFESTYKNWKKLGDKLASSQKIVIFNALLLKTILYTLVGSNICRDDIFDYYSHVNSIINRLNPVLVNLYHPNTENGFYRICEIRGKDFEDRIIKLASESPYGKNRGLTGFRGAIQFIQECSDISESLVSDTTYNFIDIDVSDEDWDRVENEFFKKLDMVSSSYKAMI